MYPVIERVSEQIKALNGKEKVLALSRFARGCAKRSALKSNLNVGLFEKDAMGVPLLSNGIYWSISHKPGFAAGVVSKKKVGIDIEQVKDVSDALFNRIVDPEEKLKFRGRDGPMDFFRAFTAKEAVLKVTTIGIKGLSKTKIETVVDDKNLIVHYLGQKYCVESFYFDGYLASVTKDHCEVQWTFGEKITRGEKNG